MQLQGGEVLEGKDKGILSWAGAGWQSTAQPGEEQLISLPPPFSPSPLPFSRVRPAEHLAVTSSSQGAVSLWQTESSDLGVEVRKQEKRVWTTGGGPVTQAVKNLGGRADLGGSKRHGQI